MLVEDNIDYGGVGKPINIATPTNPTDGATKGYVDAAVVGIKNLADDPVDVVATSNIALSGTQTIDGVALSAGQSVLATAQSTGPQNGPWVVATGAWTRPAWYASGATIAGAAVWVEAGTAYAKSLWLLTGPQEPATTTVDTTATVWGQVGQAVAYTGTAPINVSGSTISLGVVPIANGGTASATAAGARTNIGAVGKSATTIGDGSTTTYTVNHGLGTTDVIVQVWNGVGAGATLVIANTAIVDANDVSVTFASAPATNSIRVVVTG